MKDRRKNLYCGPEHELIPMLTALANYIKLIHDDATDTNGYNWPDKAKRITILASSAGAEVDKLIMIDCRKVQKEK